MYLLFLVDGFKHGHQSKIKEEEMRKDKKKGKKQFQNMDPNSPRINR